MMGSDNQQTVAIGSRVKVKDDLYHEEEVFSIGQSTDPRQNKIAADSDLGRALLGARCGDQVALEGPSGTVKFEVLEVMRDESGPSQKT